MLTKQLLMQNILCLLKNRLHLFVKCHVCCIKLKLPSSALQADCFPCSILPVALTDLRDQLGNALAYS